MKTRLMHIPVLFVALFQMSAVSCKRVKPEKEPGTESPAKTEPAPTRETGMSSKPRDGGKPDNTHFFIKVDFRVLRGMAMVQANVSNFRELAKKQGILGHLITCGVDPFLNAHELVAVVPPGIRQNPNGSVTVRGDFDENAVITCLETEFAKNRFEVQKDVNGARWLKGPLFAFQLLSPGKGLVTGITRNWESSGFPDELIALQKQLPNGNVLLLGATGEVFPMRLGLKHLLFSFGPETDHLRITGFLDFQNDNSAKMIHGSLISGINSRRKSASGSPDPKQKLLLSLLERLNLTLDKDQIRVEALIPNSELATAPQLFQLRVKGTF